MTLPKQTPLILTTLGYSLDKDFDASHDGKELVLKWHHSDPQPTEQQINDWATDKTPLPSGQLFSAWQAENGGDPIKTLRRKAKEALSESKAESALVRAALAVIVDEFNLHSVKFGQLLSAIQAATSLTNLKTLAGQVSAVPERTNQQLKNAAENKIDGGGAD